MADMQWMEEAVRLAKYGMDHNCGGPFGAVIVKDNQIIARGFNRVTSTNDPTAHAEIVAIREACQKFNTFCLTGAAIYTSCEPCPMCLSAIYWARLDAIYYAATADDAAKAGFDDRFIYEEISKAIPQRATPMHHLPTASSSVVWRDWVAKADKVAY